MSELMWWYYDLVVVAVAVLCIWNGVRKGFIRSLMQLAAMVLSACLAFWLSQPASQWCYDRFFAQPVTAQVEETLEQVNIADTLRNRLAAEGVNISVSEEQISQLLETAADAEAVSETLSGYLGVDADWLESRMEEALSVVSESDILPEWAEAGESSAWTQTAAAVLSGDSQQAAAELTQQFVVPMFCKVLRVILFFLCFGILLLVMQFIIGIVPLRQMTGGMDTLCGAGMGVLKAGVLLWLMVLLTRIIVNASSGAYPFFTEATIEETALFRILYELF